jgi:hypothetical protein
MATWHQERNGSPLPVLWHPTKWTVAYPGAMLTVSRYDDRAEAYAEIDKCSRAYVIAPHPTTVDQNSSSQHERATR